MGPKLKLIIEYMNSTAFNKIEENVSYPFCMSLRIVA